MKMTLITTLIMSTLFGAFIFPHKTLASTNQSIIIHAKRVEGDLFIPSVTTGETSTQNHQLMLTFTFTNATMYDLTISKNIEATDHPMYLNIQTPKAIATHLKVDVTDFHFSGACLKLGTNHNIVMKDVTLIAHKSTAQTMTLTHTSIQLHSGTLKQNTSSTLPLTLSNLPLCTGTSQQATNHSPLKSTSKTVSTVTEPIKKTAKSLQDNLSKITQPSIVDKTVKKTVNTVKKTINNTVSQPVQHTLDQTNQLKQQAMNTLKQQETTVQSLINQSQTIQSELTQLNTTLQSISPVLLELQRLTYQSQLNDLINQQKKINAQEANVKQVFDKLKTSPYINTDSLQKNLVTLDNLISRSTQINHDLTQILFK